MNIKNKYNILLVLMLLYGLQLFSQVHVNSPYSRYGLGDLSIGYIRNSSLGGIGIGFADKKYINYTNPAAYSAFDTMSSNLELSLNGRYSKIENVNKSIKASYISFGSLLMGFPLFKWWHIGWGLIPYSKVGYNIEDRQYYNNVEVNYIYEGYGGLNDFFIGQSFKISKNIALGFNSSFLFGTINRTKTVIFPDVNIMDYEAIEGLTINKIKFKYGLQYYADINNDISGCLGLIFASKQNLKGERSISAMTFSSIDNYYYSKDVVENEKSNSVDIIMPGEFGLGFTITKKGKWIYGADFNFQNWEEYRYGKQKDSLKNAYCIAIGGKIIPNYNSNNYLKKVGYSYGIKYNKTYLHLKEKDINEYLMTAGIELPVRRYNGMINLNFEVGKKGTDRKILLMENYIGFNICLSYSEIWFFRRKFD